MRLTGRQTKSDESSDSFEIRSAHVAALSGEVTAEAFSRVYNEAVNKDRIRALLQSIHAHGGNLDDVDLEERRLLLRLHDDIETLLELSSEAPATKREEVQTGLAGAIKRLEKNHPRLTRSIGHIAELLSGIGV